jgi:RNA polymerase sigma-70 factor (ECF subfamily)
MHRKDKTEAIWNACCCALKSFILKRVSDSSLADDLLQDVFVKIHSNIDSLQDDTKICNWAYQITRNTIIDYYRKKKEHPVDVDGLLSDDFDEDEQIKEISINKDTLPSTVDTNELSPAGEIAAGLKELVESLPEKYAQALLLVEFEGISQIELAKRLGISLSGAKSRVQRGRQMLKDSLMRCCHFEFDKYGTIINSCPATCCCCN